MNSKTILTLFYVLFVPSTLSNKLQDTVPEVNFFKLCNSWTYIDKTKLLKVFFTSNPRHSFVTCPRLFGKSTNLKMIKAFAQAELDKNKKCIYWRDTYAYKVFQNFTIGKYPAIMSQHLARYIIISLNLNMDHIKNINERKMLAFLNQQVRSNYEKYKWILKGKLYIHEDDVPFMHKVLNGTLKVSEKSSCISRLAKIIHRAFNGVKVMVLVDDYDSALTKATYQPEIAVDKYYLRLNTYISRAFKLERKFIEYILMTGTSSLSYYRDASQMWGITHLPFLEDHPSVYFCGILEKELAPVLYNHRLDEQETFKVKECFNSYATRTNRRSIYNINSVSRYLQSGTRQVTRFWQQRFQGSKEFPPSREVPGFWSVEDRDSLISSFLRFYDFFNDISVLSKSENRETSNFTLNKFYAKGAYKKFNSLVKYALNHTDNETKFHVEEKDEYMDVIRTFAFEHGYFTHLRKKGLYGVPNCEVRLAAVAMVDEHETTSKFVTFESSSDERCDSASPAE